MIVVMEPSASSEEVEKVVQRLEKMGYGIHRSTGENRTILGIIGERREDAVLTVEVMPGVEKVVPITHPFKLVSRDFKPDNNVFDINGVTVGGSKLLLMAGPCAVEGKEQLLETARAVKKAGAQVLRGGAYKPRTSPYSFQGMEEGGLKILQEARQETGLLIVSEIMSEYAIEKMHDYVDIFQVGTRNMQNFYLLRELGETRKPVLLKRGMSATIEEWLMAAEYILSGGNHKVILCERGIRTFETYTRNTLDLSAVPVVKQVSHLPIVVDPSHGTGNWRWVAPMSRAAIAAGADGLLIEVHISPKEALSDGPQSLTPEKFTRLIEDIKGVANCVGRSV